MSGRATTPFAPLPGYAYESIGYKPIKYQYIYTLKFFFFNIGNTIYLYIYFFFVQ